ncbi:KilA-N domain-containing protein [Crenobacter caeni]|uniref:KilA-N domain-containing protein n=1 Tax=Crenobacter caeni TaxID=2705474 RepID=A0A6B2KR80_9NEIS|nr:KilA-N domain-containing protein [Crenobacter caeni]NDV12489.1 KilA-N domain-containing protein [Crenobacter caeni]
MTKIIKAEFDGSVMQFNGDGWFNATLAANKYGKRVDHWLANQETTEYITALSESPNTRNLGNLIKTKRGNTGGTWLHPKLAVMFARWLDVRFAIWCDEQLDALVRGNTSADSWQAARHDAGARFRGVCDMVRLTRMAEGKGAAKHHYINEARIINLALTGSTAPVNRDALGKSELRLLELLEAQDMVLLGRGLPYEARKRALATFAAEQRQRLALPANDAGRASA